MILGENPGQVAATSFVTAPDRWCVPQFPGKNALTRIPGFRNIKTDVSGRSGRSLRGVESAEPNEEEREMNKYPMTFDVAYPAKLSRGTLLLKTFFGWLYVGIPHGFMLFFYGIAASVVMFVAWWAILFTGKFPKSMFKFVEGLMRWQNRVSVYLGLMTDEYPPFNGKP
jgi:hypothetical protein